MSGFTNFIKDIFMLTPEKGLVGLSGIKKPIKTKSKKVLSKSAGKGEPKLSDLMKKNYKKLEV